MPRSASCVPCGTRPRRICRPTAFAGVSESIAAVDEIDAALALWPELPVPVALGGEAGVRAELDAMIRLALAPAGAAEVVAHNDTCAYLDAAEREHLRVVNDYRGMLGLRLLVSDVSLYAAAKMHSIEMRTEGFFSHDSPVPGHRAFTDRAYPARHHRRG